MPSIYDREAVKPMWEELTNVGVRSLETLEEVDDVLGENSQGTTLLVINSVCGCAAGNCRPGVGLALQNEKIPDNLVTVFAGVDSEATQRARDYLKGQPPSSPNIALFIDGNPSYHLERKHIERMTAEEIAGVLTDIFNEYCSAKGPSVPQEVYEKNLPANICGSTIPMNTGFIESGDE